VTTTDAPSSDVPPADDPVAIDLAAADVAWDLDALLDSSSVDELLDRAEGLADAIEAYRGRIGELDAAGLAEAMQKVADFQSMLGRAGNYAALRLSEDSLDPANGARMAKVQERATMMASRLLFLELEWVAVADDAAEALVTDERLAFCAHHLRNMRRYKDHVLTEPEEKVLTETSVWGGSGWVRI
jgi:oligoendopeptidase F